jgi:acetyltransferase-like isoleucine patch superfamily enzyme
MLATARQTLAALFQSPYLTYRYRAQNLRVGSFSTCDRVCYGQSNRIHNFVRLRDVSLGDFTYIASGAKVFHAKIGKFCSVGPNCKIGPGSHPSRQFVSTHPAFYSTQLQSGRTFATSDLYEEHRHITIGNDVWLGEGALIMDGIAIGDGAIVGARAVVTRDVPPYSVSVGSPAKCVRLRFSPAQIEYLMALRWWDKDPAWLAANARLFTDIDSLMLSYPIATDVEQG